MTTRALGSTVGTAYSDGSRKSELRYKPYGKLRYWSGTTTTGYRFTGQWEEKAIELYYYGARYYDPSIGRFIQRHQRLALLPRCLAHQVAKARYHLDLVCARHRVRVRVHPIAGLNIVLHSSQRHRFTAEWSGASGTAAMPAARRGQSNARMATTQKTFCNLHIFISPNSLLITTHRPPVTCPYATTRTPSSARHT